MPQINDEIRDRLTRTGVRIFFVSGAVTKWYNARRQDPSEEPCLFGGWFWAHGRDEYGPFRTPSAAQRDFYYRSVLNERPPGLSADEVLSAEDEIQQMIAQAQAEAKADAAKERARERRLESRLKRQAAE